jgi:leucyl aminopeptidase
VNDYLIDSLVAEGEAAPCPVTPLAADDLKAWLADQPERVRRWVESTGFTADAGATCLVPGEDGTLAGVLVGVEAKPDLWALAGLPMTLPEKTYSLAPAAPLGAETASALTLGWALGSYRFDRYKKSDRRPARLVIPEDADAATVRRLARSTALARNLINTPANDLGPGELAEAALERGHAHGASGHVVVGDELLERNFPTIHAVGRASDRAPRLVDLTWGDPGAPKITLIGKGVCFDSGGLDLKGADNMRLMKKDMGGAAIMLGLADAIMDAGLAVRLRVLIPTVENAVSGSAMRPGDVIKTRTGTTVEVGNTDAEGRLILCDALAAADEERPELIVDIATLTGAARVAVGTDLPALFTDDDRLADALLSRGREVGDPLWRLPLWPGYRRELDSEVADINNIGGRFGGAITAGLYLGAFVKKAKSWAHIDLMGWNMSARPGRPVGGEALSLRALYAMLAGWYAQ